MWYKTVLGLEFANARAAWSFDGFLGKLRVKLEPLAFVSFAVFCCSLWLFRFYR